MALRSHRLRTLALVLAAFAGGAATSHFAAASPEGPYSPLDQLARVLVIVENQYVEPTARKKLTEGAIKGMVAELDPHSAYLDPQEFAVFQSETTGKFGGVGVEVDFRNDYVTVIAPIEGSPAARAGIKPGDQILTVDGKPMRGERIDKLVVLMRGPTGSRVAMTVRRAGVPDPLRFELTREEIHVQSVVGKVLAGGVAYVRLKQFQEGTHRELLALAAKLRADAKGSISGVILDMRNNPGGLVDEAEGVAAEMLDGGVIYTTRHRGKVIDEAKAPGGGALAKVPIVALVNEYSASSAELVAGALQDSGRALIVGAPTFGKGSVQTIYELPGGAGMRLTTMRYYTPSGRSIQAQGIKPDVLLRNAKAAEPGQIVRERDLDGHLPEEGGAAGGRPAQVIDDPSTTTVIVPPAEIPDDPTKGADFALAVGYRKLLERMGKKG